MNRKNLTAAVLAGLAGAAGIASTAQAVNLNPDGLGQVLIYPYYTVNGGNTTIFSVVNTTANGKAVKVRFLESLNSQEVLDFNLYMSAYDVWAGAVVVKDDGARGMVPGLSITDTSCTVPTIEGQSDSFQGFFEYQYAGLPNASGVYDPKEGDGGPYSITRANEGHFEMIEMGTIVEGSVVEMYTTHDDDTGRPFADIDPALPGKYDSCEPHKILWDPVDPDALSGGWLTDESIGLSAPSGGLFGGAAVVNVSKGTLYSYDARALQDFSDDLLHTAPGDLEPSLASAEGVGTDAYLYDTESQNVEKFEFDNSADAVSALFMHDTMMNEYATDADFGFKTEWVVTFPTKRFYTTGNVPVAPFTSVFSNNYGPGSTGAPVNWGNDGACEIVNLGPGKHGMWNREEATFDPDEYECDEDGDPVFSPQPPNESEQCFPVDVSFLCHEVNVVRFGANDDAEYAGPTEIFGAEQERILALDNEALVGATEGWVQVDLSNADDPNTPAVDEGERWLCDDNGLCLGGLPMTGFMALAAENNYLGDDADVLANYGGTWTHKGTRKISQLEPQ